MNRKNRYLEAFKENFNTLGLGGLVALSAATLNPLPLLAGLVVEAAYLLFVPDSKWYVNRLERRYDEEVRARRQRLQEEVWNQISAEDKQRYSRMGQVRVDVDNKNYDGEKWYREVLRKLDYLLEKYLMFAVKKEEFKRYLSQVHQSIKDTPVPPPVVSSTRRRQASDGAEANLARPQWTTEQIQKMIGEVQAFYGDEINEIGELRKTDQNLHNQAIFDKRVEVLARRQEYVGRISEILSNVSQQLRLMEDTFGLINDQIRTLSPEQMLADIDGVVSQTDSLTETLQAVSPFESMPLEAGADKLYSS